MPNTGSRDNKRYSFPVHSVYYHRIRGGLQWWKGILLWQEVKGKQMKDS